MIRPNNPAIDFDTLREKVRVTAERLRADGARERQKQDPGSLRGAYRAATGYLDRADDFAYPQTRAPRRISALLKRFGPQPERILLHLYNVAFRPAREASAAQSAAIRELVKAGIATTKRLAELERKLAKLSADLQEHQNRE